MKREIEHRPLIPGDRASRLLDRQLYVLGYRSFGGDYKIYVMTPADGSRPCLCKFMPKKYPNEIVILRRLNNTEIVFMEIEWEPMREASRRGGNPYEFSET